MALVTQMIAITSKSSRSVNPLASPSPIRGEETCAPHIPSTSMYPKMKKSRAIITQPRQNYNRFINMYKPLFHPVLLELVEQRPVTDLQEPCRVGPVSAGFLQRPADVLPFESLLGPLDGEGVVRWDDRGSSGPGSVQR